MRVDENAGCVEWAHDWVLGLFHSRSRSPSSFLLPPSRSLALLSAESIRTRHIDRQRHKASTPHTLHYALRGQAIWRNHREPTE